jgi:hypothetical protein
MRAQRSEAAAQMSPMSQEASVFSCGEQTPSLAHGPVWTLSSTHVSTFSQTLSLSRQISPAGQMVLPQTHKPLETPLSTHRPTSSHSPLQLDSPWHSAWHISLG